MVEVHVEICKGENILVSDIKRIDKILQKAFSGNEPIRPKNRKLFSKDTFFIVRGSQNRILSIGRLRPAKIVFHGVSYSILGIADIVSVVKRKGYGKMLMESMHSYMLAKKQKGIGFCLRKNSIFYRKSGLKIAKGLVNRFFYRTTNGETVKNKWDKDVIYTPNASDIIKEIRKHTKEKVRIMCPFW